MIYESLLLGAVQGITEWLPISSTGMIYAVQSNIFNEPGFMENISLALYLHLGTFLAALIYFWHDVIRILRAPFYFTRAPLEDRKIFLFLLVSTAVSAFLGVFFLQVASEAVGRAGPRTDVINIMLGTLLLITALSQFTPRGTGGVRTYRNLRAADGFTLGLLQSAAVVPGISRSGVTIAGLLLRKVGRVETLRLSFLMSLPITLGGNIALQISGASFALPHLAGLAASFTFGLLTIHGTLKLARAVNFGWFAFTAGVLLIAAGILFP